MIFIVVLFVEKWKEKGIKLNYFEVVVYIFAVILEGVREGKIVVELMSYGRMVLN